MKPVHIGCSGWNYKAWRGTVYPEGVPARRWLEHYATMFDTVEVNATFYRLPSREAVANWIEQTPDDFIFTIKASRYLTHIKRLRMLPEGVARLSERIEPLLATPKMGPLLWQLPANFQRDDERLAQALDVAAALAALHRVPAPELVRARGDRDAARAQGRARDRRPPRAAVSTPRADRRLDLRAHAPRPSRPPRQLLDQRARDLGAADRRLAPARRGVRLLQQRQGGVRDPQRDSGCATASRASSYPRRGPLGRGQRLGVVQVALDLDPVDLEAGAARAPR